MTVGTRRRQSVSDDCQSAVGSLKGRLDDERVGGPCDLSCIDRGPFTGRRAARCGLAHCVSGPKGAGLLAAWLCGAWPTMQELREGRVQTSQESPSPAGGALVDVRGDRWRVVETVEHDGCSTCRLVGASDSNIGVRRTLLLPFDKPRPVVSRTRVRRVGRRRWMAGLRTVVASACRDDSLRGAAGADIDLLDYQLEPAIACARGATRLLLADEVGLGKTIQAGLILADLRARDESARVLILCPAGLCAQWLQELDVRFRIAATARRPNRDAAPSGIGSGRRAVGAAAGGGGLDRLREAAGSAEKHGGRAMGSADRRRGPPVRGRAGARGGRQLACEARAARRADDGDTAPRRAGSVRGAVPGRAGWRAKARRSSSVARGRNSALLPGGAAGFWPSPRLLPGGAFTRCSSATPRWCGTRRRQAGLQPMPASR